MSSSGAINELIEVAANVLLQLCRLLRLPLRLSWKIGTDFLKGSYQLVFRFPENVDYQVQKLISNLE